MASVRGSKCSINNSAEGAPSGSSGTIRGANQAASPGTPFTQSRVTRRIHDCNLSAICARNCGRALDESRMLFFLVFGCFFPRPNKVPAHIVFHLRDAARLQGPLDGMACLSVRANVHILSGGIEGLFMTRKCAVSRGGESSSKIRRTHLPTWSFTIPMAALISSNDFCKFLRQKRVLTDEMRRK